eukprot:CAMPEP_0204553338 /NCGR_PEP_ID=MMETSP0661-20131031/27293_1 /ASSEMBLY_ACC=CAM_ASM_000606 /TAXON_ID=109239 /ORGANISM="Alexandrium margalefi, Strain AMGDE01CS-322" /LENGTH=572 /DNA_ID=CAMNT_0051560375 /DNA_START=14 /DNA_END=1732 /DNA_ORIENTATION=-
MAGKEPREPAKQISLGAFAAIVQQTVNPESAGPDVLQCISEIRSILVREDAIRRVATATNTRRDVMDQASKRGPARTRGQRCLDVLGPVTSFVTMVYALLVGFSAETGYDGVITNWFEMMFTIIYILELLVRLAVDGLRFCTGHSKWWNLIDMFIVFMSVDSLLNVVQSGGSDGQGKIVVVMRILRMARLVRILRFKIFKELALMVTSLLSSARTLLWAMVFLVYFLFILGVILTYTFGRPPDAEFEGYCQGRDAADAARCAASVEHLLAYRPQLFGGLSRSVFTTFRCITDGCSSVDGTPMIPHFSNIYGVWVIWLYMLIMVFVIFGLFNLIMAVMVEGTLDSAKRYEAGQMEGRSAQHVRVAAEASGGRPRDLHGKGPGGGRPLEGHQWDVSSMDVARTLGVEAVEAEAGGGGEGRDEQGRIDFALQLPREMFDEALERPEVQRMLDDLDIPAGSRASLFDTLDADFSGTIDISELAQGLMRLRGSTDAGHSVATLLATRSLQRSIGAMEALSWKQQQALERVEATVQGLSAKASTGWREGGPRYVTQGRSRSEHPEAAEVTEGVMKCTL